MNNLAAHEFALRSQAGSRRNFLLNFCKNDFDVTSECSESENKDDQAALRTNYKSLY